MNKQIDISCAQLPTARLTLRPWRESDLADFYEYARVDGVGQMAGWVPHKSMEESRAVLSSFIRGKKVFALEQEGKVIGSLGIEEYNEEHYPELAEFQGREIGYVLNKDYWGRGLMPEAVQESIRWLFEEENLDFIVIGHFDWNRQSKRVIEKCGFTYNKTLPYQTQFGKDEKSVEYIMWNPVRGKPHFMTGYEFTDDTALVQEVYRRLDENSRLNKTQAARVEFLTTVRYIEKYLKPSDRILDIGAGAGEYSLYFARQGYEVSALELADANVEAFRRKLSPSDSVALVQGNAMDLSRYADESFDIVLMLGPLYHLHSDADKLRCVLEAKRVCKHDGKLFFAFISNDLVILTMQQEHPNYLLEGDYNKDTFKLDDFPFVFHTPDLARALLKSGGIKILHEVASDGLSELLKDLVNGMDEATYRQYLRYHFYTCEKPECLGYSNHLLFVGKKR